MSAIDRGIGSEGLEQGGPNLGNDYSRKDLGLRNAGDALTHPETGSLGSKEKAGELNMDQESSRNLSGETSASNVTDDSLENDDLDDDITDVDVDDEEDTDRGL